MHIGSIQLVQPISPIKRSGISSWWSSNLLCITYGKKSWPLFAPLGAGSVRSFSPNCPSKFRRRWSRALIILGWDLAGNYRNLKHVSFEIIWRTVLRTPYGVCGIGKTLLHTVRTAPYGVAGRAKLGQFSLTNQAVNTTWSTTSRSLYAWPSHSHWIRRLPGHWSPIQFR